MPQSRADQHWEPMLKKWRGWLASAEKRDEAQVAARRRGRSPCCAADRARLPRRQGGSRRDRGADARRRSTRHPPPASWPSWPSWARPAGALGGDRRPALRARLATYVGMLVDQIHAPMRYQVEPVRGPGSPGSLMIETPRFKMLRTYDAPPVFQPGSNFFGYVGYDGNGMPVIASGKELRGGCRGRERSRNLRPRGDRAAYARTDRRGEPEGHGLAPADASATSMRSRSPTPRPAP